MVAYFCHHLSDNYVDLSDLYVDLSDIYVDLSDLFVDLSDIHVFKNSWWKRVHAQFVPSYGNVYGAPLVLYVDVKKSTCRQFEQFNDFLNSISLHFDALHDIFFSPWLYLNQQDDF